MYEFRSKVLRGEEKKRFVYGIRRFFFFLSFACALFGLNKMVDILRPEYFRFGARRRALLSKAFPVRCLYGARSRCLEIDSHMASNPGGRAAQPA